MSPGSRRRDASGAEAYCPSCDRSFAVGTDRCPDDGARLVHFREDSLIGRTLDGRFEVRDKLGSGGMGAVYRAWQASVDREVAIKVIHGKLSHDRESAKRFLREARLASRLSAPGIVAVHDFGQTDDGVLFLVMELLEGAMLGELIATTGAYGPKRAVRIAMQLCDALEAAHRQDIVHRDLKPSNIVVLDHPPGRDLIKVLDFGLAKSLALGDHSTVTQSNSVLGTPAYMSPEAIQGKPVDARGDLYAMGVILYEMLTSRPPFVASTINLLCAKILDEAAPPLSDLDIAQPLSDVVSELLAKDPADRPETAAEVRQRLVAMRDSLSATPAVDRSMTPFEAAPTTGADTVSSADTVAGGHANTVAGGHANTVAGGHASTVVDGHSETLEAPRRRGPRPPPGLPRWKLFLPPLALLLAGAIGFGVHLLISDSAETAAPAAAGDQPAVTAAGERQSDAAAPAAETADAAAPEATRPSTDARADTVTIELRGRKGARVSLQGRVIGTLPLIEKFPRSSEILKFRIERSGYQDTSESIVPDRDKVITVKLRREKVRAPPRGKRKKRQTSRPSGPELIAPPDKN